MTKRRLAFVVLLTLAVPAGAVAAAETARAAASAPMAAVAASPGPALAAALAEINRLRARAGVPALALNPKLTAAAQGHADDMAAHGYFSHTGRDGRTFGQRIRAAGYADYTALGENIARGQPGWYAAIASWMRSPGHRANMLSPSFKDIGLGGRSRYWVQDFGTRRAAAVAADMAAGPGPAAGGAATGGEIGSPARLTLPR